MRAKLQRIRSLGSLTRGEWLAIAGMTFVVLTLTVVGWGLLAFVVAPHHYHVDSTTVFGVGLGVTAYTLGMRHAFDADHIAAIDNTTRKLMADGKRPVSVGFWFSLGHSSIVFVALRPARGGSPGAGRTGSRTTPPACTPSPASSAPPSRASSCCSSGSSTSSCSARSLPCSGGCASASTTRPSSTST